MRHLPASLCACIALLSVTAPTQIGNWAGGNRYYVSTAGSDSAAGTRAQPWRTVTHASTAIQPDLDAGTPVTINVLPGFYNAGETFPILFPARGVTVEADAPGVTISSGNIFTRALTINRTGWGPNTVIQGITFTGSSSGLTIDPAILTNPLAITPDAVEVRLCTFSGNFAGIDITAPANRRSAHVIEFNDIVDNGVVGIAVTADGPSSTWIRANLIELNEIGIQVSGRGAALTCQPRIESNFVVANEFQTRTFECSPYMVNNTIAYATPVSCVKEAYGVFHSASDPQELLLLANNVIWNPLTENPCGDTIDTAPDLDISGSAFIASNDIEDATDPNVGANGNISINPFFKRPFPPYDVHLAMLSPVIGLGTRSFVLPTINLTVGSMTVRADIAFDRDGDARLLDFDNDGTARVDMGGDEVSYAVLLPPSEVRLTVASGADAFGNMSPAGGPINLSLRVTGTPSASTLLYYWVGGGTAPITANSFVNPYGNLMMDPSQWVLWAMGSMDASGAVTFNFTLPVTLPESEFYLQAVTTGSGLDVTNRLRLEYNF